MAKIVIQGVEYPVPTSYTGRELSLIQRVANVGTRELTRALEAGNIDVVVSIAAIVLTRAGQSPDIDKLYDLDAGEITGKLEPGDEGFEEQLPPPIAAEAATETETLPRLRDASGTSV